MLILDRLTSEQLITSELTINIVMLIYFEARWSDFYCAVGGGGGGGGGGREGEEVRGSGVSAPFDNISTIQSI